MSQKENVKKVAITIVGDSSRDDYTFAGVVIIPESMPLDDIVELYCDYIREDQKHTLEGYFMDWLVATKGLKEEKGIGFIYILPEQYDHVYDEE